MKLKSMCLMLGLAVLSGSALALDIGDRVECNWKNGGKMYPGVIAEKTGSAVFIHYNDGDKEHTTVHNCRPLGGSGYLGVGSRVSCRWKGGSWYPGVIAQKTGDAVFIHYNDGDKEHTTIGMCRPR